MCFANVVSATFFPDDFPKQGMTEVFRYVSIGYLQTLDLSTPPVMSKRKTLMHSWGTLTPKRLKSEKFRTSRSGNWRWTEKNKSLHAKRKTVVFISDQSLLFTSVEGCYRSIALFFSDSRLGQNRQKIPPTGVVKPFVPCHIMSAKFLILPRARTA
jgi:hypothetical protein